jgi:23S rRNA (pseudouridine1915-N3)-methyltransferase
MKITVIAVGKINKSYIQAGIKDYEKRFKSYCTLDIIEVKEEKPSHNPGVGETEQIKQKEGERIYKHISPNTYVIALDIKGKMHSSEEFANFLSKLSLNGQSDITFVIGGSLGLHDSVLNESKLRLSFSPMTFPHQLMRLILLEQVYRAFTINRGEPYHK